MLANPNQGVLIMFFLCSKIKASYPKRIGAVLTGVDTDLRKGPQVAEERRGEERRGEEK